MTLKNCKPLMKCFDKTYTTAYVSCDDKLNESQLPALQEAVRAQDYQPVYDGTDDWVMDAQTYGVDAAFDEVVAAMRDVCNDSDNFDDFVEKYRDDIREIIEDRDDSSPVTDLLKHTNDLIWFYDTGTSFGETWNMNKREFQHQINVLRRVLKIKDHSRDDNLSELLANASGGGQLVVYFRADADDMMSIGKPNAVKFTNPHIAIIDTGNGSGHNVYLPGHKFNLPYDPENLLLEATVHYNYTDEVCGMYHSWCKETRVQWRTLKRQAAKIETSPVNAHMEREAALSKTFAEGGCTAGDTDMRRHRNTYYKNEFPCGTHCPHCGQFWID